MALRCNGYMAQSSGVWHVGANAYLSSFPNSLVGNAWQTGRVRNQLLGDDAITSNGLAGIPSGYRHPGAWVMPQKSGAIAARNTIFGLGALTGTAQSGRNADATITGSGGVSDAPLGLIISLIASITGSGTVSAATIDALTSLAASLTGSSNITTSVQALADLVAGLTGSGTAVGNNTQLMDIAAEIRGYSDLTPEGLRDAVWNASAAAFNNTGTMGEKLNDAGSASNPWTEVIESGFTAAEILRLIAAAVQGNATGLESGAPTFKGLDGTTDRVTATYASGTRVVTARDAS